MQNTRPEGKFIKQARGIAIWMNAARSNFWWSKTFTWKCQAAKIPAWQAKEESDAASLVFYHNFVRPYHLSTPSSIVFFVFSHRETQSKNTYTIVTSQQSEVWHVESVFLAKCSWAWPEIGCLNNKSGKSAFSF